MNENELLYGKVIAKLNQAGLGPTDPAVKDVLDKLATQKDPQKLKKLLEDLLALDIDELKEKLDGKRKNIEEKQRAREEDDKLREQQKQAELDEQARIQREMQARDITYDPEFNQKLSKLVSDMKNARNQEQGKFVGIPKEFFKEIPDDKFSQVVEYLENELGFEFKSRTHGVVEQEGRSVEEETVTKDDLLNGDVKAVIPMDKLQSKEFERLLDDKGKDLAEKAKGIEAARDVGGRTADEGKSDTSIDDDLSL